MLLKMIPLEALEVAPENIRKTRSNEEIEALAASINEYGLKTNLVGYEVPGQDDMPTVFVTAGGTRLLALRLIAKEQAVAPVPVLIEPKENAIATGLAENLMRQNPHMVDKLRAFRTLRDEGTTSSVIQRAFGIPKREYNQIMALADLPEVILDAFLAGDMTYECTRAFTLGTAERAEEVYNALKERGAPFGNDYNEINEQTITREMTEESLNVNRPIGRYVGEAAYEKAGGRIITNLFRDESLMEDATLAKRLATEKLERYAKKHCSDYLWTDTLTEHLSWSMMQGYVRVPAIEVDLRSEEEIAETDALVEKYENEPESFDDADEDRLNALDEKSVTRQYPEGHEKVSGVIVHIDFNGKAAISPPIIRPEDVEAAKEAGVLAATTPTPEDTAETFDTIKDTVNAYSAQMIADLKIVKRTALQNEMVQRPGTLIAWLIRQLHGRDHFFSLTHNDMRPPTMLIEQGLKVAPEIEASEKKTPALSTLLRSETSRDSHLAAHLAARILDWQIVFDQAPTPDIRAWWTPNAEFFRRLKKTQLIEVLEDIEAPKPAAYLHPWDKRKKEALVDQVVGYFSGAPITVGEALSDNKEPTPKALKAVENAAKWLPPPLRPVPAEKEEIEEEAVEYEAA